MLKLVVGMVILKVLLKLSCMVSQTLVYQVTVAVYISDIVTIIIATPHPFFFHNLELHQLKHKLFPFRIESHFVIS